MRRVAAWALALSLGVAACGADEPVPTPAPTPAGVETPAPRPSDEEAVVLRILEPQAGAETSTPLRILYAVSGFDDADDGYLVVTAGTRPPVRLALVGTEGELLMDEVEEGTHDMSFGLADGDGTPVDDPGATVVVADVTVVERGAGGGGLGY